MGDEKYLKPNRATTASDVAKFLKTGLFGEDLQLKTVTSLNDITANALIFSKGNLSTNFLKSIHRVCIITSALPDIIGSNAFIIVDNPRLAFAKTLEKFFIEKKKPDIGEYTVIHPTAKIGKAVLIGNGCTIGRNVVIGDHTEIRNNVVIADSVKIGRHCRIKSNTVIGEKGFGFDFETDGTPVELPHLKSVQIGDHVEIGALNTVVGGALKDTIIQSYVKTDDHVHVAHNCVIGAKTVITACTEISGSVIIGEQCWLGPNCSIINKIKIGDNCFIGLGTVVLKDVPSGAVIAGNPAKVIRMQKSEL